MLQKGFELDNQNNTHDSLENGDAAGSYREDLRMSSAALLELYKTQDGFRPSGGLLCVGNPPESGAIASATET